MALSTQEQRIHKMAAALVAPLKRRKYLELRGGRWEFATDFTKTPRLLWIYGSHRKEPFAIVPSERQIIGLGPLHYGYAEQKLKAAQERLKTKPKNR